MRHGKNILLVGPSLLFAVALTGAQQTTPFGPTPPADVAIPANLPPNQNPIDFFDDYSWLLFASMVWSADPQHPGQPEGQGIGETGPLVFEGFKTNADTFQPGGADPGSFDDAAASNPCGAAATQRGALVIAAFSKFEELQQAGFGNLVGPIVAQNKRYVRYVTGYNKVAYDHIRANKLYLRSSSPVDFPSGSIITKSAWIEMQGVAHPERFHRRMAWIIDPATGSCSQQEMGLVGLHIVQKTPSRPQWIWSSFEQVDNVPEPPPAPATFHDGTQTAMPGRNPNSLPTAQVPTPFNITRITPIHPSTITTNGRFTGRLAQSNSVWQFYKLVMTQWPLVPNSPQTTGAPANTFPGTGATSAFANTTMETFDQKKVTAGCMACHEDTHIQTDFIWSVATHAFPRVTVAAPAAALTGRFGAASPLERLRARMESAVRADPGAKPR